MKTERTRDLQAQRVDRQKANRARKLATLPQQGDDGDIVVVGEKTHLRLEGQWIQITSSLEAEIEKLKRRLEALDGRVKALEDG